ncbi:MAG: GNAT family N-acetyltransferase [Nitrosomonadales bacterium]|nr:GNAT family N-acetyltransferase [Nitrosomonadales bacterium]
MAKTYRLQSAALGPEWDGLVAASDDATIFSTSAYLAHTGCRLGLYYCYNADELRAGIAVIESADGENAVMDDLVIYGGPFFGPPTNGQNRAQRISERFEIATFIAEALATRYRDISFALAPSVTDVRPFLWHNYGQTHDRYAVDVRYTSYLDIADFAQAHKLEDIAAYGEASSARRQQVRYARRDGVATELFDDVNAFVAFYRMTMERQGEAVETEKLDRMEALVAGLIGAGAARMFVSRTREGAPGSIAVYAFDRRRAYYLFGASDPALRDSPAGTAVLWDAFTALAKEGITQIDLEGVNSPRRGWFKLSFGGDLRAYYQVYKKDAP